MSVMKRIMLIVAGMFLATCGFSATAQDTVVVEEVEVDRVVADTPSKSAARPLAFAWGADISGAIDCSGHNMSTLGCGAQFGFQWQWVRFFGIGAEADIMVGNSSRTFPVVAIFRTDFSRTRRLLFMDLRGGVALNYIDNDPQETVAYGSIGLGVTLANSKSFSSHIIIGYTYNGRKNCYSGDERRNCPGMSYANFRLGLSF